MHRASQVLLMIYFASSIGVLPPPCECVVDLNVLNQL